MKRIYFIYSKKEREDSQIFDTLKYYIPTTIDIQTTKIDKGKLRTLDGKLIRNVPQFLEYTERPIYIAEEVLDYLENWELMRELKYEEENSPSLISQMQTERKIIIGRSALKEMIEKFRKKS
ncbi:MAG: hypothetical protein AABX83_04070 [Nanoarchaeota archaeon]